MWQMEQNLQVGSKVLRLRLWGLLEEGAGTPQRCVFKGRHALGSER